MSHGIRSRAGSYGHMLVRPACCVTWDKALFLSGPQKRSSHSLFFIINAEWSHLKREKSEVVEVT